MKTWKILPLVLPLLATALACNSGGRESGFTIAEQSAIVAAVSPSLVRVEYTLQYDKGEQPTGGNQNLGQVIADERPLEASGFLVACDRVLTADLNVHPRFVKSIAVRSGEELIPARLESTALQQNGRFLKLEKPFKAAKPVLFDAKREKPYYIVGNTRQDGIWQTYVRGFFEVLSVSEDGRKFIPGPNCSLIVDKTGAAVGASMGGELAADDTWKGDPATWKTLSAADEVKQLKVLENLSRQTLLRVRLTFRSPKKTAQPMMRESDDSEGGSAQMNVPGILAGADKIMVLCNLKPKLTARLESIAVFSADGKECSARFHSTLSDYGAFMATLDKPLSGAAEMDASSIIGHRRSLLTSVELRLQGENRVEYFGHCRIDGFEVGWHNHLYPVVRGTERFLFVFDDKGRLVAFPVARREKAGGDGSYRNEAPDLTACVYVKDVLADLARNTDPSNIPLTEGQESRLAWLGVELQPMDRELARENKVSDLTHDGRTGAMVSFVYPGSPADKAGVKMGNILLRIDAEGQPKPVEVVVERYGFADRPFPWDRLDQVPDQYYDQIPRPWPPAENHFTRTLTDLGFGKKFKAEFFVDGKIEKKAFEVAQSPLHYDTAAHYKSTPLGLTVNDLTYEVRRYFQKADGEPGVIVSRIEPGSKVSVAGMKPYEIITHINDKPVKNVKEFEQMLSAQGEIKFDVKRMTTGRVVKIVLDAKSGKGEKSRKDDKAETKPADKTSDGKPEAVKSTATSKPAVKSEK